MQILLDNLSAFLIGSTLFVILTAVHYRGQQSAVEATTYYALKQRQLTFVQILEHDINAIVEVGSVTVDPVSSAFRMRTRSDPSLSDIHEVSYVRTLANESNGMSYYRIVRYVGGVASGESGPFVTDWHMQLLNGEGKAVSNPADGRQIAVSIEMARPATLAKEAVETARWEATLYPPLLQQRTTI